MATFGSDEILWYNVGKWGDKGYAVPNFGDDPTSLNSTICKLVALIGRNLSAVMHHSDVDLRTPPSINTLMRIHKLVVRARNILSNRALSPATPRMEPTHSTPAAETFLIFPVPYFKVRNQDLKEWCGLTLTAIGEACQHTENRVEYEISTAFAGLVGQYLQRVYVRMATEMFGVGLVDSQKPDFTLTDAQIAAYDPTKWFTSTELIDVVPPLVDIPTEDDLQTLTDGIPASMLLNLQSYPRGMSVKGVLPDALATVATSAGGSFAPPPSP